MLADSFPCLALPVSLREIRYLAGTILTGLKTRAAGLDILVACDRTMQDYNFRFLGLKSTTNVLSFPEGVDEQEGVSGQLIINFDAVRRESLLYGQEPSACLARLMVHGMLHLAGYEHGAEMEGAAEELEMLCFYSASESL